MVERVGQFSRRPGADAIFRGSHDRPRHVRPRSWRRWDIPVLAKSHRVSARRRFTTLDELRGVGVSMGVCTRCRRFRAMSLAALKRLSGDSPGTVSQAGVMRQMQTREALYEFLGLQGLRSENSTALFSRWSLRPAGRPASNGRGPRNDDALGRGREGRGSREGGMREARWLTRNSAERGLRGQTAGQNGAVPPWGKDRHRAQPTAAYDISDLAAEASYEEGRLSDLPRRNCRTRISCGGYRAKLAMLRRLPSAVRAALESIPRHRATRWDVMRTGCSMLGKLGNPSAISPSSKDVGRPPAGRHALHRQLLVSLQSTMASAWTSTPARTTLGRPTSCAP